MAPHYLVDEIQTPCSEDHCPSPWDNAYIKHHQFSWSLLLGVLLGVLPNGTELSTPVYQLQDVTYTWERQTKGWTDIQGLQRTT